MTEVTQPDPAPVARSGRSFAVLALILVCLAAAAGGYVFEANRPAPLVAPPLAQQVPAPVAQAPQAQAQAQQAQTQQTLAQPAAPTQATPKVALLQPATPKVAAPPKPVAPLPAAPLPPAPSVDVVRIDQYGSLVMAGRAQPGETLIIHNGATTLGTVTAGADGQWVFLPDVTLPSGVHQLSVADVNAPASDTAAQTVVLLSTPGSGPKSGPMVVLTQGNGPPRVLVAPPGSHPGPVGLDVVQYDDQGHIRFTGHAQPNGAVRLYVNDHLLGDAVANAHGIWTLAPKIDVRPGIYKLRTDELAANGRVLARSEVPFARASVTQILAPGQAVVQPGDCLWTIARHNYGHGIDYTAIFEANRDQIRDPRRIYPGQAFHMPTAEEAAHAPPPSALAPLRRTSRGSHPPQGEKPANNA